MASRFTGLGQKLFSAYFYSGVITGPTIGGLYVYGVLKNKKGLSIPPEEGVIIVFQTCSLVFISALINPLVIGGVGLSLYHEYTQPKK